MSNKFKMGAHFCKTPSAILRAGRTRWKCPDCGKVYWWKESTRVDRHGRTLKDGGYWRQITQ